MRPPGHADYNGGGTYRHVDARAAHAYDWDHDFKLNLWSYDEPRFTRAVLLWHVRPTA